MYSEKTAVILQTQTWMRCLQVRSLQERENILFRSEYTLFSEQMYFIFGVAKYILFFRSECILFSEWQKQTLFSEQI